MIVATACWWSVPEAADEQILEIAERDSAIDRATRGKGDDQRIGAPRRSFGALGRVLDPCEAVFELGDPRGFGWRSSRRGAAEPAQSVRGDGKGPCAGAGSAGDHAKEPRGTLVMRQPPSRGGGAGEDQHQADQQPRAPSLSVAMLVPFIAGAVCCTAVPQGPAQRRRSVARRRRRFAQPSPTRFRGGIADRGNGDVRAAVLRPARQTVDPRAANGAAPPRRSPALGPAYRQPVRDRRGWWSISCGSAGSCRSAPHKCSSLKSASIEPSNRSTPAVAGRGDIETRLARRFRRRLADGVDGQARASWSARRRAWRTALALVSSRPSKLAGSGASHVSASTSNKGAETASSPISRALATSRSRPAPGAGPAVASLPAEELPDRFGRLGEQVVGELLGDVRHRRNRRSRDRRPSRCRPR